MLVVEKRAVETRSLLGMEVRTLKKGSKTAAWTPTFQKQSVSTLAEELSGTKTPVSQSGMQE